MKYKAAKLLSNRFPPNSGDFNPIETVWAKLRRDLAKREFADLKDGTGLKLTSPSSGSGWRRS